MIQRIKNTVSDHSVLLTFVAATLLYSILAAIWMDADAIFYIGAGIKKIKNPLYAYDGWHFGSAYHGSGPFYSWLVCLTHPILRFFGYSMQSVADGTAFNHFTYYLFKWLNNIPFALAGGFIAYKMYGLRGTVLWLFNPMILYFTIMGGLMDFYGAFFLLLGMYFLERDKLLLFLIAVGFGLISKQTVALTFPAIIVMLLSTKGIRSPIYIIILLLPYLIFTTPYKLHSPEYASLMSTNFWGRHKLNLGLSINDSYFVNIILYSLLLTLLIIKKPKLSLANFCLWSAPFIMIYMFSYGLCFERWSIAILPLLLGSTIILCQLINANVYFMFFILTLLPPLIQFGYRDPYFHLQPEPYTLFENTNIPFRLLNLFERPELGPSQLGRYLLSAQTGIIIAFWSMIAYAIYKIDTVNKFALPQEHCLPPRLIKRFIAIAAAIFVVGLSVLFCFSYAYKYSDWQEQVLKLETGEASVYFYPPNNSLFQRFEIKDIFDRNGNSVENVNLAPNGDFEDFVDEERPDGWTLGDKKVLIKRVDDPDKIKKNKYAVKITSTNAGNGMLSQEIENFRELMGSTVTATGWVWSSDPGKVAIILSDGNREYWAYHPGDSKYHELSVSCPINADTKELKIMLWVYYKGFSAIFDDIRVHIPKDSIHRVSFSPDGIDINPISPLCKIDGLTYIIKYKYKTWISFWDIFLRKDKIAPETP